MSLMWEMSLILEMILPLAHIVFKLAHCGDSKLFMGGKTESGLRSSKVLLLGKDRIMISTCLRNVWVLSFSHEVAFSLKALAVKIWSL